MVGANFGNCGVFCQALSSKTATLTAGNGVKTITGLSVQMPDSIAWTVSCSGLDFGRDTNGKLLEDWLHIGQGSIPTVGSVTNDNSNPDIFPKDRTYAAQIVAA